MILDVIGSCKYICSTQINMQILLKGIIVHVLLDLDFFLTSVHFKTIYKSCFILIFIFVCA